MDRKSKILFSVFGALLVLSISASYYRFMIIHDYVIEAEVDCDPSIESCFVWICDPTVDGEDACTGDPEEDTWHYKFAYRNAMHIPECSSEEVCDQFLCSNNEQDCFEVQCSEDSLMEYEIMGTCNQNTDLHYGE